MLTSKELAGVAVKALDSKKGKDIKVLHTEEQTTLADYFVICGGASTTQVKALADAVERLLSDRAVLARMRENCLRRREELPTLERYCVRMEEIYREEIRRRERGTWPQR